MSTANSFRSGNLAPAVLIDFDDTAAAQNVAEMLLNRFGDPNWQEVRRRFRAGELTLKEYQEVTFRDIQASRADMQGYVKQNANLRPYFRELWSYCQQREVPMAIVSQGLDFYIEALLEQEGFSQVPVYAVETSFTPEGIGYHYRFAHPGAEHLGNSKGLVVDRYKKNGHHVVFVGDGRSDFEAAVAADLVFAHSVLAEECRRQGIPYRPFSDFGDVLSALQQYPLNGSHAGSPTP